MAKDLDLVFHGTSRDATSVRGLVVRAVRESRTQLKIPRGKVAELSVSLVTPARMRALNRKYRKVDKPTDVLAFPLPGPNIRGYTAVSLGDLFICPAVVRAKAKASKRPVRTQMNWTIVHGLLHLAGHDHEQSTRAAARMAAQEQKILKRLG